MVMKREMTDLSRRAYEQATSEGMTIQKAIDYLEKEAKVRTLREKLERFSQGRDLRKVLVEGLKRNHPDLGQDSVERRVRGWLNDAGRQTLRKRDAIEICFILGLGLEEADGLASLVAGEGLHWRNPDELVYLFALKQGMDYQEAESLHGEMQAILSKVEERKDISEDSLTSVVKREVQGIETKEELAEYLQEASSRLGRYHNNAYKFFLDRMEMLKNLEMDEEAKKTELFTEEKLTVRDILKEYFFVGDVLRAKKKALSSRKKDSSFPDEEKLVFTVIQKQISDNWPDETMLSKMKTRKADVTRKVLILLFLATDQEKEEIEEYENEEDGLDFVMTEEDLFQSLYQRLDQMLIQCGFMPLDPRSPFDWLVLYCICVDDLFDMDIRMRGIFREMFGEGQDTGDH